MVHHDRIYVSDLAQQSNLAKRKADDAHNAGTPRDPARAATGSAIMGRSIREVTFFSAGAELMLGYRASEVVGVRSIADFIDPAQITERRQINRPMRKALDRHPETVAEAPGPLVARAASSAGASSGSARCRGEAIRRRRQTAPVRATSWWPSTSPSASSWQSSASGSTRSNRR